MSTELSRPKTKYEKFQREIRDKMLEKCVEQKIITSRDLNRRADELEKEAAVVNEELLAVYDRSQNLRFVIGELRDEAEVLRNRADEMEDMFSELRSKRAVQE